MSDVADIGHNAPPPPKPLDTEEIRRWLGFEFDSLKAKALEVSAGLSAAIAATPVIDTPEQLQAFADNLRIAKAVQRTAEDNRKEAKAPFLEGGRDIDAWFKEVLSPLDGPVRDVQMAMDAYQTIVAAERRRVAAEAARRAREEADRKAAEAAAAMFSGSEAEAEEMMGAAQRAATKAERAETKAEGGPAAMVRTHTDLGTVATARDTIDFEIVDPAAVPEEFKVVDHNRIRAALREMTKDPKQKANLRRDLEAEEPKQPIPGVRVFIKTTSLVR